MSSQDLKGESYVADYLADPKVYGDVEHCGWTMEEEEDYDPQGKGRQVQMKMKSHYLNLGTCMRSSKSQASRIEQRNLRSSLSLFASCRKTSRNYAKRY